MPYAKKYPLSLPEKVAVFKTKTDNGASGRRTQLKTLLNSENFDN